MRYSTEQYLKNKSELKEVLGVTAKRLDEILNMSHEDALEEVTVPLLFNGIKASNKYVPGTRKLQIDQGEVFDLFDDVFFYKKSLHLITARFEYDENEPFDTTVLTKLDKDVIIDTISDGGDELCVRVFHRDYPVYIRDSVMDWSIDVSRFLDPKKGSSFTQTVLANSSDISTEAHATAHFCATDNLRKVYIAKKSNGCGICNKCKTSSVEDLNLRPKHCTECKVETIMDSDLFSIIYTAIKAIEAYVNREKVAKKASKLLATDKVRSIMVATETEGDTERVIPLIDYIYEYHESVRKEYQGGHHKSPVSHDRRGYFRKSKRGNYIRVNGEFVEVQKGTGTFTKVAPTKVKPESDFVQKFIV